MKVLKSTEATTALLDAPTCNDSTCGEKHKVDGNHLCGIKHFHRLIEKSVSEGRKKKEDQTASTNEIYLVLRMCEGAKLTQWHGNLKYFLFSPLFLQGTNRTNIQA